MSDDKLTLDERQLLLRLARQALEDHIHGRSVRSVDLKSMPEKLREFGSTFVTLKKKGLLRGCIGSLEPHQPLVLDVCEHVISAAIHDYRFSPVGVDELGEINIEISRLTKPLPLNYRNADELRNKLRPGVDGVVLQEGFNRATFLPQVWEKIPEPDDFLSNLCSKMGVPADTWRFKKLEVFIYQVEEFHE